MEALGVGVVHVPGLEPLLADNAGLVDVVEVEPQTFWVQTGDPTAPYRADAASVERLRGVPQAKLVHGVGFPVGGTRPPEPAHLAPLLAMIGDLEAVWASEHLSFNRAEGPDGEFKTGFLLPPRQTPAGAAAAAAAIREVAAHVPVPFAVETGVNYLRPRDDELLDGAFVATVVEAADCGILLDLHNVWTNERNGRQPVAEFVAQLPLERVWEVHVAGGSEFRGYWLDSHSGAIPDALIELAVDVVPRLPNLRALIFELAPTDLAALGLAGVQTQLERLRDLWRLRETRSPASSSRRAPQPAVAVEAAPDPISPAMWEDVLGGLVVGRSDGSSFADELAGDPGVDLIHTLVCEFRAGMVVEVLLLTSRLLLVELGDTGFRALLGEFWRTSPPQVFKAREGEAFAAWLADRLAARELDIRCLPEVLAFERAVIHALVHGEGRVVPFPYDPLPVLRALAAGRRPTEVDAGRYEVEVTAENGAQLSVAGVLFGSASG